MKFVRTRLIAVMLLLLLLVPAAGYSAGDGDIPEMSPNSYKTTISDIIPVIDIGPYQHVRAFSWSYLWVSIRILFPFFA